MRDDGIFWDSRLEPRDLLLFFLPLDRGNFQYPLSSNDIRTLVDNYSEELAKEIKGELSSFYKNNEIEMIFQAIRALSKENMTYEEASDVVNDYCTGIESSTLLNYLFDRSLIGTVDDRNWYTFKCRQSAFSSAKLEIDTRQLIVVQYGVRNYLRTRGYV